MPRFLQDAVHHDSQITSLSSVIARRDAQIRELELALEMKNALVVERDHQIALLARQVGNQGAKDSPRRVARAQHQDSSAREQRLKEPLRSPSQDNRGAAAGRSATASPLSSARVDGVLPPRDRDSAEARVEALSAEVSRHVRPSSRRAGSRTGSPSKNASALAAESDAPSALTITFDIGRDEVDDKLRAYFDTYPDFRLEIDKLKKGWYFIGRPVSKKVYIKMNGRGSAVLKIGGGFNALEKFLDEYRLGAAATASGRSASSEAFRG